MNRRTFFMVAPIGIAATPFVADAAPSSGMRISMEPSDPGYRQWCILRGDKRKATIYLDGIEQKWCRTADEAEGMVERIVETPGGNRAHGFDGFLWETVHGKVRIEVE